MEILSCEFCLQPSPFSCILDCGHSICYNCSDNYLKANNNDYKDERYFNCQICNNITLLPEISTKSLIFNSYTPIYFPSINSRTISCACSNPAILECITCQSSICETCQVLHSSHFFQDIEDTCPVHHLNLIFYCESDFSPLCQICLQDHLQLGHKLWNKDQIIRELWGSIKDIEENREKIIYECEKTKFIGGDNTLANERLRRIVEKKSTVWYEKVTQAIELVSMEYPKSSDIEPFVSETLPITQQILMHLTTGPVLEDEPQTLVYITRGSCEMFIYNFIKQSFTNLKSSQKILKWSGITQYSPKDILITGGKLNKNNGSVSNCFSVNIETGLMESFPDMPSCHSSHISLQYENSIYIISGKNSNNGISNFCEKLNLSTKTWTSLCSNIIGRTCAAGVVHKENIFIIGGCKNNTVEKYLIKEDQWLLLEFKLFEVVWQHLAIDLTEKVLIFGGDSINDAPTRYSYLLDMETGEVSQLDVLPIGQSWLCGWYPYSKRGNHIWIMNKELKFLTYNLDTKHWSSYKNKVRKTK